MKLFGTLRELVAAVFRKDGHEITLRPNQTSSLYTTNRAVSLPQVDNDVVLTASGYIVNADINASAAIAYSKLALSNSIVNADVSPTAAVAYSKLNLSGSIVNADISNTAAIADSKLATIATAGKVSNSATTATSSNTASAIVARDASGNFSAGTITATLSGNATNVSGTVAIANGGTGATTQQTALNALAGTQVSGRYLRSDGTNTSLSSIQAADVPTLNQNTTGTAANVTGIVAPANGGTGQNFSAASGVIKASAGTFSAGSVSLTADVSGTLPVANGGTGITSLGSGIATFLGTPSSANLASAVTDETGSGSLVFGTSPTLSAPQVNSSLVVQRIATPSSPSAGFDKIYTKSDGLLYKLDSSGNEVAVGSGASGSGEINAVLNPSAATDTTGWAAGTSHTVAKDIANSPLSGIVSTSFAISSSAAVALGSQTSTSGVYDAITLPSGLQNRKLKVEFFFTTPASSAGTWAVALYQGSTKLTLSTDSSGDTILPSGVTGGKFTAYFDSSSSSAYSLNLVQRTRTSANTLYITNVIVGPGIQPQGAVVGEWVSYTPTTNGLGTVTAVQGNYQRVGSGANVNIRLTTGTPTAAEARIGLPGTITGFATSTIVGFWERNNSSTNAVKRGTLVAVNGNAYLLFSRDDYTTAASPFSTVNGSDIFAPSEVISVTTSIPIPIAEWAGSGTVQLAQNDVEYAYNTGNVTAAGGNDNSSFAYGPNGTPILAYNSATASNSNTTFRVRFQTPVQTGDQVIVELNDGTGWFGAPSRLPPVSANGASYGIVLSSLTSTDYAVNFGNSGYGPGAAASYGAPGGLWSALAGASPAWRWRVRKSSAGAAVGFGIVSPGTSAGLVSAAGLPGNTTGNVIAQGYVGEKISGTRRTITTTLLSYVTGATSCITLNKGVYLMFVKGDWLGNNTASIIGFGVSSTPSTRTPIDSIFGEATPGSYNGALASVAVTSTTDSTVFMTPPFYLNVTADGTQYYPTVYSEDQTGLTVGVNMAAIRIA